MQVVAPLQNALAKIGTHRIWARLAFVIFIVLICLAIGFGTMARERTFSLVATTLGGEITFNGQQNDWQFSEVIRCTMRASPDFRISGEAREELCDNALFKVEHLSDIVVSWRDTERIQFRSHPSGGLQIRLDTDSRADMPPGSLLIIPQAAWADHGALAFQGAVQLGGEMATGSTDYLLSGHWEALQTGLATSLVRDITEVVKSGTLVRGSTVDFIKSEGNVISFGHLTPPDESATGIEVALLTERAPIALRVSYYGLQEPAIFKPDWIDTISSSTLLVALAALLSLIAGIVGLVLAVPGQQEQDSDSE